MQRRVLAGVAAAAAFSVMTGVASAATFTFGSTTEPSGATASACDGVGTYLQTAPSASFVLPAGGQITQWQTNTAGATPGDPIMLVAAAPLDGGLWRIDAVDPESIPNPAGSIATFTPATPMMVSDGDVLGISGGSQNSSTTCAWAAPSALGDTSNLLGSLGQPTVGEAYKPISAENVQNVPGLQENFAATEVATEDSAVTTSAQPQTVAAGSDAVLSSTVTDNGPAGNPLTFTDTVPSGLTIDTAITAAGTCSAAGQTVTCTLPNLRGGQSATVNVIVTPTTAGTYSNAVSVSQPAGATDPMTSNNTASGTLTANSVVVAACHVTNLAKLPLGTAKTLLSTLGCKAGKVTKSYSKSVAKGDVIKTTPGKGTYAAARSIAISESKGPKPKKKHHVLHRA
jgi:hypothetical protein